MYNDIIGVDGLSTPTTNRGIYAAASPRKTVKHSNGGCTRHRLQLHP